VPPSGLAQPLQFGPVRLATNLLLAPIAGYCDLAFRLTVREFTDPDGGGGVGLACTDLLSPDGLLRGTRQSLDLARTNDEDKPVGMQLYGSVPAIMADGARWAADHGATVVDINMGCPVDKVCKKDGGSKLMCDLGKAVAVAEAARAALPEHIPLTAKMRLGWSEADYENGVACELARRLIDVGVVGITVHGRTTEQKFKGQCRREGIRRVVDAVNEHTDGRIPVIGNGDVTEPEHAVEMIRETGCAGVMIGRGALSKPWIFRQAWALQRMVAENPVAHAPGSSGSMPPCPDAPVPAPSDLEKLAVVRRYFDRMRTFRDDHYAMFQITRRISWFAKEINGSHCRPLKEAIRLSRTPEDVYAALDMWAERGPTASAAEPALA